MFYSRREIYVEVFSGFFFFHKKVFQRQMYPELNRTSEMEIFEKTVSNFQLLTIFTRSSSS